MPDITELLNRWSTGDGQAFEELLPLVYTDLERVARGALGNEQNRAERIEIAMFAVRSERTWRQKEPL